MNASGCHDVLFLVIELVCLMKHTRTQFCSSCSVSSALSLVQYSQISRLYLCVWLLALALQLIGGLHVAASFATTLYKASKEGHLD
jgi:hypothetical protein